MAKNTEIDLEPETPPAPAAKSEEPKPAAPKSEDSRPAEIGGRPGPEPTRYGDWEKNGIISDF